MEDRIIVRHIASQDFETKAAVQAQTWRETYKGLLPQWLVDRITPEFALSVTKRHDPATVFVAFVDGRLVGFAEFCDPARPPSDYPETAELASLYVLKQCQGLGIGRRLVESVFAAVSRPRLVLWVFDGNLKAQAFYRHMGFEPTGRFQLEDGGELRSSEFANFDASVSA
ncbi:Ribosomal protein S18 acetylase RimI [Bifidobacterium bohemicum]|uniref:Acetyltransferase (GNAT) family n=1 Tax=Bifidobacterium bohemicum DSM 22767 TaxID=1437606 RepID=A0A086ZGA7_9BIFI|nr:GNAT family N-acetyltransferase [Bifidobacterium bohemicum]KFI45557.1 acetyltransferase (GNAT) family [Bifidobacterium bohemicum DSM 22767]SCC01942.1 Ribosomal protein S18 acetylase RimI [Bifidobacterium bohemicum]